MLRKHHEAPEDVAPIIESAFEMTNNDLLQSSINTDLSGSTVVAVFVYKGKLICFNVGDSRAVLYSQVDKQWKITQLSDDQKPSREDEKERILKFGGYIIFTQVGLNRRETKTVNHRAHYVYGCPPCRCRA